MKQSIGISYRINNQEIISKKLILCVYDDKTAAVCAKFEQAFMGAYPFGYVGTTCWFGAKTSDLLLDSADPAACAVYDLVSRQGDYGVILYCAQAPSAEVFTERMGRRFGSARVMPVGDWNDAALGRKAAEVKRYIDSLGAPTFYETQCREWAEWSNLSFALPLRDEGKRILLVGDSICFGYTNPVREQLADYCVDCLHTSEGTGHQNIHDLLEIMLTRFHYDAVHLNIGIHTHLVSDEEYERNLNRIFDRIARLSPGSAILFATTTTSSKIGEGGAGEAVAEQFNMGGRKPLARHADAAYTVYDAKASSRYAALNEAAKRICRERAGQIEIDDLFAECMRENPAKTDPVHFCEKGYRLLADSVVRSLRRVLPAK